MLPTCSVVGEDDDLQRSYRERVAHPLRPHAPNVKEFSEANLLSLTKELVYSREDSGPALTYVVWSLDIATGELSLYPSWTTVHLTRNDLKRSLAMALVYEVPVVADDEHLRTELLATERELLAEGFVQADADGNERALFYAPLSNLRVDGAAALDVVEQRLTPSPTEMRLALAAARRELDARASAGAVLDGLRLAVTELESALGAQAANEAELQACLNRHPVLFGADYEAVLPQQRLGGDYVMDYALRRPSGLVDLVEIEASTHALFTQRGDPTNALVHAEQQVLDWLQWLEDFTSLARRDLPQLQRPLGYIVIGRTDGMIEISQRRLAQRNQLWASTMTILTYDDLLARARALLAQLEGLRAVNAGERG